jgi:MFS transporter, MHS family, proline/betaine transporter
VGAVWKLCNGSRELVRLLVRSCCKVSSLLTSQCILFLMASGTLLGGLVAFALRELLTHEQLVTWGWRLPFLSGIVVSFSGFYLKSHGGDHDGHHYHTPDNDRDARNGTTIDDVEDEPPGTKKAANPLRQAFALENLRSLLASSLVPMLWSAGFYLSFVWMSIFMSDLIETPVPGAFGINSASLFFSVCLLFPFAGILSDRFGRIMTIGGVGIGLLSPIIVLLIGRGKPFLAFLSQCVLGVALSLWGAPMCAWLVESFAPDARLTSVSIGYNIAQAIAGGSTPFLATVLADNVGPGAPGFVLTALAVISIFGLLYVAPPPPTTSTNAGSNRRQTNFHSVPMFANPGSGNEAELEMIQQSHSVNLKTDENELL